MKRHGTRTSVQVEDTNAAEEIRLMHLVASGDRAAFATLIDRHMGTIFKFSYSMLNDHALAEDVTQDACIRLWDKAQEWEPSGRVRSWLLRIAHNLCIDEVRSRRPQIDIAGADNVLPPSPPVQDRTMHEKYVAAAVKEALLTLPARQRTALMLVYYSDCSNTEAAGIMGLSVDALELLLARGKKILKDTLAKGKSDLIEGGRS